MDAAQQRRHARGAAERACSGTHTRGREVKRSGAIPACTEAKIEKPDDILGEQSADACGRSSAGTRGSRVCTQRSAHRGQGGGTAWRAGAVERFSESATSESRGQLPAGWPLRQPLRRRVEQERLSSAVPRRSKPSSCVTGAPSSTLASKSGAHHVFPSRPTACIIRSSLSGSVTVVIFS